jgi:hypothetical protein
MRRAQRLSNRDASRGSCSMLRAQLHTMTGTKTGLLWGQMPKGWTPVASSTTTQRAAALLRAARLGTLQAPR